MACLRLAGGCPLKVALYARKSKGNPAEAQLKRLRAVAQAEGHEVVLEASDVASGRNPHRPGWEQVMAAVRGGHTRAVWITKTDRAMRSAKHYLEAVEQFEPRGCQLRVLDQPMASVTDFNDPLAKAFRTIGAVFAQLEVDLADERSNEGHEVRDGRMYGPSGTPVGRPPLYGEGHKFRNRNGRREHDRARCPACGETGGQLRQEGGAAKTGGVGEPFGFPTASLSDSADEVAGVQLSEQPATAGKVEVAADRRPSA